MPGIRIRPTRPHKLLTLGYGVLLWMREKLVHGITGEPLWLNEECREFVLAFYEIDFNGRFTRDRAAMRRARGTGKSPLAGVLADAELCGPVRFAGHRNLDEHGFLWGQSAAAPWVQLTATTLEQTRPIMSVATASWSEQSIEEYGLEIGKEAIVKHAYPRGRLACVPNNPRGLRGPRPSAVFADEVSEWVSSNGGHDAMIRIRSNLAKDPTGGARLVELSNAFTPGEDSHAERTYQAYTDQTERTGDSSIHYDSLEADPALRLNIEEELREAIEQASGDSDLNVDRLITTAMDPQITVSQFRREHLNQLLSSEDSLISAQLYDTLSKDVTPLGPEDAITLGFDGALTSDGTAIVAYRLWDKSFHVLHYWEPDPKDPDWRIDEAMVDETFRAEMLTRNVKAAAVDVHPFESWAYGWERDFGHKMLARVSSAGMLIRDNRTDIRGLTHSCEALVNEAESKSIRFFPSALGRKHWANAKRRLNRHGFTFGKETRGSKNRVDVVAAELGAYMAAQALAISPQVQTAKPARVVQMKP